MLTEQGDVLLRDANERSNKRFKGRCVCVCVCLSRVFDAGLRIPMQNTD